MPLATCLLSPWQGGFGAVNANATPLHPISVWILCQRCGHTSSTAALGMFPTICSALGNLLILRRSSMFPSPSRKDMSPKRPNRNSSGAVSSPNHPMKLALAIAACIAAWWDLWCDCGWLRYYSSPRCCNGFASFHLSLGCTCSIMDRISLYSLLAFLNIASAAWVLGGFFFSVCGVLLFSGLFSCRLSGRLHLPCIALWEWMLHFRYRSA